MGDEHISTREQDDKEIEDRLVTALAAANVRRARLAAAKATDVIFSSET
jgi:hypothetical protein